MRDVAEHAGVAVSTVSRVVSTPERISPATRQVVLKAIRDLGYSPAAARPQRRGLASVALLVPDITNPFYFDIIRGSQERLRDSGYTQLLVDTEESPEAERASLELLEESASGAILAATRLSDEELAGWAGRLPLVTVNREVAGVPSVMVDAPAAFGQVVAHLASLGHQRLCYVSGPAPSATNERRWASCVGAAQRVGVDLARVGPFTPKTQSGAAAADAVLVTGATAAIAFNDILAIGMLRRFAERGVRVPDEISVTGCDDIFGADFCSPPLTTITARTRRIGREATGMLLAQLGGGARIRTVELPVYLTVRDSTGPAPA
jgi:LacI family transcriptional regulator